MFSAFCAANKTEPKKRHYIKEEKNTFPPLKPAILSKKIPAL